MKTTIYDLLGMIKDNKAPKKIMYRNVEFVYESGLEDYFPIFETDKFSNNGLFNYLFDEEVKKFLYDEVTILETTITYNQDNYYQYQPYTGTGEVEIKCNLPKNLIESDKIEKLEDSYKLLEKGITGWTINEGILKDKINEIIDYINSTK